MQTKLVPCVDNLVFDGGQSTDSQQSGSSHDTSYRHTPAPLQPEGGHLVARRAAHEAAAPGTRGQLAQVSLLDRGVNEISRFHLLMSVLNGC